MSLYTIDYDAIPTGIWKRPRVRRAEDLVPGAFHRHFALGRAALLWLCRAMQWGPGDRVLLPAFACYSVVTPFTTAGLTPEFYDVRDDLSVDIERLVDRAGPRVRAGLIMHYFGWRQSPGVRQWLAAQSGPVVWIEDLSHALFTAMLSDGPVATGEVALTSYRKLMPCPDGSTLVFRDAPPASVTRAGVGWRYRGHGIVRSLAMSVAGAFEGSRRAARATAPAAATLQRMLKRWRTGAPVGVGPMVAVTRHVIERFEIDGAAAARRRNAIRLAGRLRAIPGCTPLVPDPDEQTVPMALPVRFARRPEAERALKARGILVQHLWPSPPGLPPGACPVAQRLSDELLCFPIDERYGLEDMDRIADLVTAIAAELAFDRGPGPQRGAVARWS